MKISTIITKRYFGMKMADLEESGFFLEFKECKPFWDKRLGSFNSNQDNLNVPIVFLVGSKPHYFKAVSIWMVHRDFVYAKYAEAIKTEFAYAIKCFPLDALNTSMPAVTDTPHYKCEASRNERVTALMSRKMR